MSALRECLESIKKQRMAGIPEDEILVNPDLVDDVFAENPEMSQHLGSLHKLFGASIGIPCPRCGHRKPNKVQWMCDMCGKNFMAHCEYI